MCYRNHHSVCACIIHFLHLHSPMKMKKTAKEAMSQSDWKNCLDCSLENTSLYWSSKSCCRFLCSIALSAVRNTHNAVSHVQCFMGLLEKLIWHINSGVKNTPVPMFIIIKKTSTVLLFEYGKDNSYKKKKQMNPNWNHMGRGTVILRTKKTWKKRNDRYTLDLIKCWIL